MFAVDQTITFLQAIDRLRIVEFKWHFAQQIKIVRLANVFACQMNNSLPKLGFGNLQITQIEVDFSFGKLVQGFIYELGDFHFIKLKQLTRFQL